MRLPIDAAVRALYAIRRFLTRARRAGKITDKEVVFLGKLERAIDDLQLFEVDQRGPSTAQKTLDEVVNALKMIRAATGVGEDVALNKYFDFIEEERRLDAEFESDLSDLSKREEMVQAAIESLERREDMDLKRIARFIRVAHSESVQEKERLRAELRAALGEKTDAQ